ncbi:hypothetical protein AMTRI_Chr07g82050 [Amborella trichopoda]
MDSKKNVFPQQSQMKPKECWGPPSKSSPRTQRKLPSNSSAWGSLLEGPPSTPGLTTTSKLCETCSGFIQIDSAASALNSQEPVCIHSQYKTTRFNPWINLFCPKAFNFEAPKKINFVLIVMTLFI